jgi:uncharacterized protein
VQIKEFLGGLATGSAVVALSAGVAFADDKTVVSGPMAFNPIAGSAYGLASADWTSPYVIPAGFTQKMVSDETVLDIYSGGVDDLADMLTTNETGRDKDRYMFHTQEVGSNGSVAMIDLKTGSTKVLLQDAGYHRLDGIRWTPWETLLFAEETTGGRLFEAFFDKKDPTKVTKVETRRALGILAHEGIDSKADGTTFVIDELTGGGIFKFVPDNPQDLSEGQLYAIKAANADGTGAFEWIPLNRAAVKVNARAEAAAKGASGYERPEDVELIGNSLYVAITGTDRVVKVDLTTQTVSNFVKAGVNVGVESPGITGLNAPDNLAEGPDGRLWVCEDNDFSDIYVSDGDTNRDGAADGVHLFASLKDVGAETSGIYFGKDAKTLYLNIQHPDKPLADGTWKITRASDD